MTTRWIIAAVAAVGAGVLAASMMFGPTYTVTPGDVAKGDKPGCKAEGVANLDFTLKDMDGATVRLADHKGKVLVLNFWATWCPPCKAEIPGIIEAHSKYKDKGVVILGISEDDDAKTLKAFSTEWKINYPMLVGLGEDKLFDAYGPLYGIPTTVFISREGAICGRHVGPASKEEFEKEIKTLL
jgi:peroxiredoxin